MSSTNRISDDPRPGRTGLMRSTDLRSEPEHVVHRVEPRRSGRDEPHRPEGAMREGVAAMGPVGQLEPFAARAEHDGVVADDVSPAEGVDPDLFGGPFPDEPVPAVDAGVLDAPTERFGD